MRALLLPDVIRLTDAERASPFKLGDAWTVIQRMIAKVSTVVGELTDTAMKIGSDRLDVALIFYAFLAFAARTGTPGAQDIHNDLKTTYPAGAAPEPPPTPPTP